METRSQLLNQIKNSLNLNQNTKLESTIISKAQKFTGLKTEGLKTLLKTIKRKNKAIQKANELKLAKSHNLSRKEYLSLKIKAYDILKDFETGYTMGENRYLKLNDKMFCADDNTEEYANSCSYKANHGHISINLNKKELRNIEKIEGVWTVKLKNNKAKWLEESGSKQYYDINWVEGYVVGTSHAQSYMEALRLEALKVKNAIDKFDDKEFIGVNQIKKLGACDAGINAFCHKHNLNKDFGYQLGYLKSLNGEGTRYFNRISK